MTDVTVTVITGCNLNDRWQPGTVKWQFPIIFFFIQITVNHLFLQLVVYYMAFAWHKCIICILSQLCFFLISSQIRTELLGADSIINTNPRLNLQGGGLVAKSCPTLATPMDCSPPGLDTEKLFRWSNMCLYYLLNYYWNESAKFRNPHRVKNLSVSRDLKDMHSWNI